MLRTLLESRPARRRRTGGIAVSILLHAGIIGVAATATAREVTRSADRREERILFVPQPLPVTSSPHRVAAASPASAPAAPMLPALPQVAAPSVIPVGIPDVADPLAAPVTAATVGASEFRDGGTGSIASAVLATSAGSPTDDDAGEVLRILRQPREPEYPDLLRRSGLEGRVTLLFRVDSAGRVEAPSISAKESTHALFTAAATRALLDYRFAPPTSRGRRYSAWAVMTFDFRLSR
jgi:TonB family protein